MLRQRFLQGYVRRLPHACRSMPNGHVAHHPETNGDGRQKPHRRILPARAPEPALRLRSRQHQRRRAECHDRQPRVAQETRQRRTDNAQPQRAASATPAQPRLQRHQRQHEEQRKQRLRLCPRGHPRQGRRQRDRQSEPERSTARRQVAEQPERTGECQRSECEYVQGQGCDMRRQERCRRCCRQQHGPQRRPAYVGFALFRTRIAIDVVDILEHLTETVTGGDTVRDRNVVDSVAVQPHPAARDRPRQRERHRERGEQQRNPHVAGFRSRPCFGSFHALPLHAKRRGERKAHRRERLYRTVW